MFTTETLDGVATPLTEPPLLDDEPPLQPARNKINAVRQMLKVVDFEIAVKVFMIFPFKLDGQFVLSCLYILGYGTNYS